MNWGKIATMSAINPMLGVAEWHKQDKVQRDKNTLEFNLRNMRVGESSRINGHTVVRDNLGQSGYTVDGRKIFGGVYNVLDCLG